VEASVVARLLGMKLLRLEATVIVLPADVAAIAYVEPDVATSVEPDVAISPPHHGGTLGDAVELLARASKTIRSLSRGSAMAGDSGLTREGAAHAHPGTV
jgi:thiamine pyrophosphate-dependent acetolactate synthase large subunit-like protein